MPAQAGIQFYRRRRDFGWIPAGAGMTFGGFFLKLRHDRAVLFIAWSSLFCYSFIGHPGELGHSLLFPHYASPFLLCIVSAYCADTLAIVSTLPQKDLSVNIFVGNLAFTTTEQDLRQLFAPYGTVDTIRIMTDRDTGHSRGFGFIEMPEQRAAQSAIAGLQGKELGGRALTVNEARPREPRR